MRDIFGIRFPRLKSSVPEGDTPDAPPKRNSRKHALALVAGFVALFFVAAIQQGDPAVSQITKTTLIAVLKDPLTLFAERSPGGRSGALLPTKPQERVLSTVRERDPTGTLPGVADPVVAGVPEAGAPGGPAPEERVLSGERGGLPGGGSPGGFAPFGGGPGGGGPGGLIPEPFPAPPPGPGVPGEEPPPGIVDPGPPIPPGPPPTLITDPPVLSPVPEPATWAMMILGFFAIGAALRRRARTPLPSTR